MNNKTFYKFFYNFKYIIILFIIFILFLFSLFILTGSKNHEENLKLKTAEELNYIQDKIISMMNKVNHITLSNYIIEEEETSKSDSNNKESNNKNNDSNNGSDSNSGDGKSSKTSEESNSSNSTNTKTTTKYNLNNNSILIDNTKDIDWDYMKDNIELINSRWTNTLMDLHGLNINNEDILNFSLILDQVILNIKNEDKANTLINLANLYSYFPSYLKQFDDDQNEINIVSLKSNILNGYALIEQDRWDEAKQEILESINSLTNVINSLDLNYNYNNNSNNNNKNNKIYVLLNDLNNSIVLKDKDIFYIKYKNIMQELVEV